MFGANVIRPYCRGGLYPPFNICLPNKLDAGLGMSLTQAKESSRKLIERKTKELDNLNEKMITFSQIVKSAKYKAISDEVISARIYQGKKSVGYRFNAEHNFDEFKKAILA
ncbi:hypothetical protein [Histophilus somni]|uniref:hypothetical protein n=1 Tax=Histophilus somni TaxID=731 RepID=UPI00109CC93E|nr:hypothetical protein [Histophilus somni]MBB5151589.1 hypothetical protein [Histophilus somni]THA47815.1 hypothetical protein E5431_09540 [Histophilus somni]